MRKIEMSMCEALTAGKKWWKDNTGVDEAGRVWLYGTCIARYWLDCLQLRTTGYAYCGSVTKSRLRALRSWADKQGVEVIEI